MKKVLVHTGIMLATICFVAVFSTSTYASHQREILWDKSYKENESIPVLQERVFLALDNSIALLASTIDAQVAFGEAEADEDFTLNGTIAYRYDYLMYRLFELNKLDQRIKEELAAGESTFVSGVTPVSVIQKHRAVSAEYTQRMTSFMDSLAGLKQAVRIQDVREELNTMQRSMGEIKSTAGLFQDLPSKPYRQVSATVIPR
ncbi:MAG: hypothetical protein HY760_06350 [Nitrospirae bacterium]|nr:hypothetical protein [Nitrospirota bacterium]